MMTFRTPAAANSSISISVVIPTYNEEGNIGKLCTWLQSIQTAAVCEIIVVDSPHSNDATFFIAQQQEGIKALKAPLPGRAAQMNTGAQYAKGSVLYFVHADTRPPEDCFQQIEGALQNNADYGCFSYQFDSNKWYLRFNARQTRKNGLFTGGGDQTLFIRKTAFTAIGRFDESLPIMEDFELWWRLKKSTPTGTLIRSDVTVSARKYQRNSYVKVNSINGLAFFLFKIGVCPFRIKKWYRQWLG